MLAAYIIVAALCMVGACILFVIANRKKSLTFFDIVDYGIQYSVPCVFLSLAWPFVLLVVLCALAACAVIIVCILFTYFVWTVLNISVPTTIAKTTELFSKKLKEEEGEDKND